MKKILFAVAFLLPFIAHAQFNYKAEDKYMYYSNVVQVDTSFTISDEYKDAKLFIKKLALVSTKITTDDEKGGTIAADIEEPATFKTQTGVGDDPMTLKYSLKLELKKGRYRYTFDNILITTKDKDNRDQTNTLYDLDKDKGGGMLGIGRSKRILKAMDLLFLRKIDVLNDTMKKRSDDF